MGAPVPTYAKVHRGRPFPCGRGGNGLYQEVMVCLLFGFRLIVDLRQPCETRLPLCSFGCGVSDTAVYLPRSDSEGGLNPFY